MTTIYLVRHAESEGNLYRRVHSWYDSLITDNGYRQIQALARRFEDIPIDAVWSSDMFRTKATARSVYLPKGLPLQLDPQLREMHMGEWEDLSWGEAYRLDPDGLKRFLHSDPTWHAPNAETFGQTGDRAYAALQRIAQAHAGQTVAVFCHGTTIRQVLAKIRGIAPEDWHTLTHSDNTAVNLLTYDNGQFEIVFDSDISHLDESMPTMGRLAKQRKPMLTPEQFNLWFRPLDWESESHLYLQARQEAWTNTHPGGPAFQAEDFLPGAQANLSASPWGITVAMAGEHVAGLLELDARHDKAHNAGYIPFFYVIPDRRRQGLGVQLIGKAVSFFRPLGCTAIRLHCAPDSDGVQQFYQKYGFQSIGREQMGRVVLDSMEKHIGYER